MKKLLAAIGVVVIAASLIAACGGDDGEDPEAVLVAFEEATNGENIDTTVALFSEDAVIIDQILAPPGEVDLAAFARAESQVYGFLHSFEISDVEVDGNTVTFSTTADTDEGCFFSEGHEITVEDGKITRLHWGVNFDDPEGDPGPNC